MSWPFTYAATSTLVGAVLAVGVGVADAAAMHVFGKEVDLTLVSAGIGALLGTAIPRLSLGARR